jgi:hypothetical protein
MRNGDKGRVGSDEGLTMPAEAAGATIFECSPLGQIPVSEPYSTAQILRRGLSLIRKNFRPLFLVTAIWWAPLAIALGIGTTSLLVLSGTGTSEFSASSTKSVFVLAGAFLAALCVVCGGLIQSLSRGASVHAVAQAHVGQEVSVGNIYRSSITKLGRLYVTSLMFCMVCIIVMTLWVVIMSPVLLLPGAMWSGLAIGTQEQILALVMGAVWSFPFLLIPRRWVGKLTLYHCAIVLEDESCLGAIKRSRDLLSGKAVDGKPIRYIKRLTRITSIITVLTTILCAVMLTPLLFLWRWTYEQLSVGQSVEVVTLALVLLGILALFLPIVIGTMFVRVGVVLYYFDLRFRKEGFVLPAHPGAA